MSIQERTFDHEEYGPCYQGYGEIDGRMHYVTFAFSDAEGLFSIKSERMQAYEKAFERKTEQLRKENK